MADAIVITLLNTGLRVDELVSLMWSDLVLQPRSGKAIAKFWLVQTDDWRD
jgi:integrase